MLHSAVLTNGPPVLSLTPDSIAALGELDLASLSDLWAVFTKCKDSLQDGRRLENLSWRLWFDQSNLARKELPAIAPTQQSGSTTQSLGDELTQAAAGLARVQEQGWSSAESESDWASDTSDESDKESIPIASTSTITQTTTTSTKPNNKHTAIRLSPSQSTSALDRRTAAPPCPPRPLTRDWRSCATINGAGLQRVISGLTTLPPLSASIRAKSAVHIATPRLLTPPPTSRGVSAPEVARVPKGTLNKPLACTKLVNSPAAINSADLTHKLKSCTLESTPAPTVARRTTPKSPPPPVSKPLVRTNSATAHPPSRTTTTRPSGHIRRNSSTVQAHAGPAATPQLIAAVNADAAARVKAATAARLGITPVAPMERSVSSASFEPKSLVKGFDTSVFEARPGPGSIAPPPTPAQSAPTALLPSPPSAMKVPGAKPSTAQKKKLFFISSPNSDSEDDHSSSRSRERKSSVVASSLPRRLQPSPIKPVPPPQVTAPTPANAGDDEEWDDEASEEEDDEDASSGWGSDYSTENDSPKPAGRSAPAAPLFEKRPSTSELKPRGPGLLSQLFHPDMFVDDRSQSDPSLARHRSMLTMTLNSKSVAHMARTKSYLGGKPDDVELETSSDEDNDSDEYESSPEDHHAIASALARRQQLEAAGPIAPPQTPRTTRRAMLATELSESLRRNLLWERQTRNRHLGPQIAPQLPPAHQAQLAAQNPPDAQPMAKLAPIDGGLMAPHPSPATRNNSPVQPMVRRHTTGTGLYKLAQQKGMGMTKLASPPSALLRPSPPTVSRPRSLHAPGDESASDSSDDEEDERPRGYASPAEGVRVW